MSLEKNTKINLTKEISFLILHARMLGTPIQKIGELWGGSGEWEVGSRILTQAEKTLGLPVAYTDSDELSLLIEDLHKKLGLSEGGGSAG